MAFEFPNNINSMPITGILIPRRGTTVFTIHADDSATLAAVAPTRDLAEWLAVSLSRHYRVALMGESREEIDVNQNSGD